MVPAVLFSSTSLSPFLCADPGIGAKNMLQGLVVVPASPQTLCPVGEDAARSVAPDAELGC